MCSFLPFLAYLGVFFNFATVKKLFKNLIVHISLVLDATFMPNLTFLGLLSSEILFGEKTVTHTDKHPQRHPHTQLISPSVN